MNNNFSWDFKTVNAAAPATVAVRKGGILLVLQPTDHKYGVMGGENVFLPAIPSVISGVESTTGYELKPNQEVAKMFRARMVSGTGILTITSETDGSVSKVEILVF